MALLGGSRPPPRRGGSRPQPGREEATLFARPRTDASGPPRPRGQDASPQYVSMLPAGVNPHRLRAARPREPALLEESDRPAVGDQDLHVETLVAASQPAQDLAADAPSSILGMHQQV